MTASPVGQALPVAAPMPSAGQAGVGAQRIPSEVAEQPAMVVTPLPTTGRMELPTAIVAPTVAGATPSVEAPLMQAEVAATMIGQA